jgi:hypothetical protein
MTASGLAIGYQCMHIHRPLRTADDAQHKKWKTYPVHLFLLLTDISDLTPVDRSHPTPAITRSGQDPPRMDLASKNPFGGRIVTGGTTPPTDDRKY